MSWLNTQGSFDKLIGIDYQPEYVSENSQTSSFRRARYLVAAVTAIALGLLPLLKHVWIPPICTSPPYTLSENAAWIGVDWTSSPPNVANIEHLASDMSARGFHYLFPFVSYLRSDGTFNPSFTYATEFVDTFRRFDERTHLVAWLGVPVANTQPLRMQGWVDLADPNERQKIANFAVWLTTEAGFDGIHLDVEPVDNDNQDFLRLLEEVKTAIGTTHLLSVAGNHWQPPALSRLPVIGQYGWSSDYVRAVATHVNQIVSMAYDSSLPAAALYRIWLREQVLGLNQALVDSPVQLLIGISISQEVTPTHQPRAENLDSGLAGICAALNRISTDQHAVDGIAIYASWEADSRDWRTLEDWLRASHASFTSFGVRYSRL